MSAHNIDVTQLYPMTWEKVTFLHINNLNSILILNFCVALWRITNYESRN